MSTPNNNSYQNKLQDERLSQIEKSVRVINEEMGDVKIDVASIKVTQKVISGILFLILSGLIGLFLK